MSKCIMHTYLPCLFCFCYGNINHHCRCYLNIFYINLFIILNDITVQYDGIFYSFDMIRFHFVVYCIIFVLY